MRSAGSNEEVRRKATEGSTWCYALSDNELSSLHPYWIHRDEGSRKATHRLCSVPMEKTWWRKREHGLHPSYRQRTVGELDGRRDGVDAGEDASIAHIRVRDERDGFSAGVSYVRTVCRARSWAAYPMKLRAIL